MRTAYSEQRQRVLREACNRHKDSPNRAIAQKLASEHPALFKTVEVARSAVRHYFGLQGDRERAAKRGTAKPPRKAGELPPLPKSESRPWEPFVLDAKRILCVSDIHLPHHSEDALAAALAHGDKLNPDAILINGDLFDFYQISRFAKDPTQPSIKHELECGRQFFEHLRARYKKARIVLKLGNHDERWDKYLQLAAPLLFDIPGVRNAWHGPAGIADCGVEVVGEQRIVMLGKLPVLHGHELQRGFTSPVNPARGAFLRTRDSVLIGHYHQTSDHTERSLLGTVVVARSTGCLCGLNPEYARVNRWDTGFATVEVGRGGEYECNLKRIIDGRIY